MAETETAGAGSLPAGGVPEELMDAALYCCGDVGYRNLSPEMIALRYGGTRSSFYRYFRSKADCFEAAYRWKAGWLVERLLSSGEAGCDVRGAVLILVDFMVENPMAARAIFGEALGVGGPVSEARRELVLRLASALDNRFRQPQRPGPPALAGEFTVLAIEELANQVLVQGKPEALKPAASALSTLVHRMYGVPEEA